jgi:hypothetical protein
VLGTEPPPEVVPVPGLVVVMVVVVDAVTMRALCATRIALPAAVLTVGESAGATECDAVSVQRTVQSANPGARSQVTPYM